MTTYTATCHTEDCMNADQPIDVGDLLDLDGQLITDVSCGPCGQPITDLDPPLDGPTDQTEDTP